MVQNENHNVQQGQVKAPGMRKTSVSVQTEEQMDSEYSYREGHGMNKNIVTRQQCVFAAQ